MGKTESLLNNFRIWDFNERHIKHVCVPVDAGQVNGGVLPYDLCV